MCVWVDVSLYPWWCQLAVAVKPASAPPGCGYPGTVGTRSSWHQFCHLISLSFRHFFHSCPPVLGFYLFCMLDTILRRGLTARVSPWSLMPFTQNSAQNLLFRSHPAKKFHPRSAFDKESSFPESGGHLSSSGNRRTTSLTSGDMASGWAVVTIRITFYNIWTITINYFQILTPTIL